MYTVCMSEGLHSQTIKSKGIPHWTLPGPDVNHFCSHSHLCFCIVPRHLPDWGYYAVSTHRGSLKDSLFTLVVYMTHDTYSWIVCFVIRLFAGVFSCGFFPLIAVQCCIVIVSGGSFICFIQHMKSSLGPESGCNRGCDSNCLLFMVMCLGLAIQYRWCVWDY